MPGLIELRGDNHVLQTALSHPYLTALTLLAVYLVARHVRGRQQESSVGTSPHPQEPPVITPTIPVVGHVVSQALSYAGFVPSLAARYPKYSVFTLYMGASTKNHYLIAPSLIHLVSINPKYTNKFSGEPFFFQLMETVFGDERQLIRKMDQDLLWNHTQKIVHGMMRESFLQPALSTLISGVNSRVFDLTTFTNSTASQKSWERAASIQVPGPGVAEASLHTLLRDFVGHLAITILMGPDILDQYPDLLPDLFTLDENFALLLSPLPRWTSPLRRATAARSRVIAAIREHHIAYYKYQRGIDPGPAWSRIDETSNIIHERIQSFAKAGDFDVSKVESDQGWLGAVSDSIILWALNVNANQVTFWMIFHIFANPTLLSEIRAEIEPHVKLRQEDGNKGQPSLDIDLPSIRKHCTLLQGAFLETMRWESGAMLFRYVNEDFTLTESAEDARIFNHDAPQTYVFKKGEYIVLPHGTHQMDERYFPNPESFDARRFWTEKGQKSQKGDQLFEENDTEAEAKERVKVEYKTMLPWGGGASMCKGRKFAESEVLIFVAAVITCWDIEYIDESGKPKPWKHPGHKGGSGAVVPATDVRVRLRRRDVLSGR
jgi:hypothetical protein